MVDETKNMGLLGYDDIDESDFNSTPVASRKRGKKRSDTSGALKALRATGYEILKSMPPEELSKLGAKANTLIFEGYAVINSRRTDSVKRNGKNVMVPAAIGAVFSCTEDLQIEVIDPRITVETGIASTSDITYRTIPAGKRFVLSFLEALYLCTRPEFSCQFVTREKGEGYMNINSTTYGAGKALLPTPTFHLLAGAGGARDMEVPIDIVDADGKVTINPDPEFARFAFWLEPVPASRSKSSKATAAKPQFNKKVITAVAVSQLLKR